MADQESYFRNVLKTEFSWRLKKNPSYSLRAFARDLGVAPSNLSEIFAARRGLSRATALKVARKLSLEPTELDRFLTSIEAEHGRSSRIKKEAAKELKDLTQSADFKKLDLDSFELVSDWAHFALLELMLLKSFRSDPSWIAKRLGITQNHVAQVLGRLQKLSLITQSVTGKWIRNSGDVKVGNDIPSRAIRQHHSQVLHKADTALEAVPIEEREFGTLMMAINSKDLDAAKKELRAFRRKFCKDIQQTKSKDRVYCLSIQFFPLDQESSNTGDEL